MMDVAFVVLVTFQDKFRLILFHLLCWNKRDLTRHDALSDFFVRGCIKQCPILNVSIRFCHQVLFLLLLFQIVFFICQNYFRIINVLEIKNLIVTVQQKILTLFFFFNLIVSLSLDWLFFLISDMIHLSQLYCSVLVFSCTIF